MNMRIKFFPIVWLIALMLAALGWATPGAAQQTALNIKIEKIDDRGFPKMEAYVSVFDAQGFPIKNLKAEDFSITEDGKPASAVSVAGFQNTEQPLAIALVIDTSGSMQGKPLANSISAAKAFAKSLAPADQLALVSFATKVNLLQGLTADRSALETQLDTLKAKDDTSMYDGLIEGIGLLKNRSERRVVLLLTDGKESGISKFTFDNVVNESVRWSTPIYPIGFGSVNKAELNKLAQLTGGAAQINPDSTTLSTAFNTVLSMLREQYKINFTSSLGADGLEHPLEVGVKYQNGFASASRNFNARPGQVVVKFVEPLAGQVVGGKVTFKIEVLAPAAVRQVDLTYNGQPMTSLQSGPYDYVWDSTVVTPGSFTFAANAVDVSGNTGQGQLMLDVREPIKVKLNLTPDQELSKTAGLPAAVDSLAALAKIDYFIDGQLVGTVTTNPAELSWDTTKVDPGYHTINVQAFDVNGFKAEDSVRVNVILQRVINLWAVVLLVVAAAVAIILPLSVRRRRTLARAAAAASAEAAGGMAAGGGYAAAGVSGAVLVENAGTNPGQTWPLGDADTRLGRKRDENDIPLRGLTASRKHALIRRQAEGYVIYALNPQNPLTINGRTIEDQAVLCPGDTIQAGDSIFRFEVNA